MGPLLGAAISLARARLTELRAGGERRPVFIGLSGPQGGGKSTLASAMVRELGDRAVTLSVDDVYLTRAEQVALAERQESIHHRDRGYPGTHDLGLGVAILDGLARLGEGARLALPSYDKGAHSGRGDRRPSTEWPTVVGPCPRDPCSAARGPCIAAFILDDPWGAHVACDSWGHVAVVGAI